MKNLIIFFAASVFISVFLLSCKKSEDVHQPIVVSASGDITLAVNNFRNLLGATLNETLGHTSGRREINWDAVPDSFENADLPADFFNPVGPGSAIALQRGFRYAENVKARISNNNFSLLEPTNANQFAAFSGSKTFSAVSSNVWNVEFEVPGQTARAAVKGFGAVFSDVDNGESASIEFFSENVSLGIYKVPPRTTGSHSFLGVYFKNGKITSLKIKQGNAVIANGIKDISEGGIHDLVVMDDFLYDEPQAF